MRRARAELLLQTIIAAILFWLVSMSAFGEYKTVYTPGPNDPIGAHVYELGNGLRVYISENHEKPRFHAQVAVRAGNTQDPSQTTGLAHYLEHLLFKGNEHFGTLDYEKEKPHLDRIEELYEAHFREEDPGKRADIYREINRESRMAAEYAIPNELDMVYAVFGASDLNAYTWYEETVYYVDLPSNRLSQWAFFESDRFVHPVFRLFHTELEAVYEEKNTSLDDKSELLFEAVNKKLFKKHPYGQQTTLGEPEHLKKPSIRNIRNFYDTYYVPNNMALCLAGDINPEETMRIVDERFSRWERKKLPPGKKWKEKDLGKREEVTVNYEGEESVLLSFRLPGRNHRDSEALQLAAMILSNGSAGLIDLNLNQRQEVRSASASASLYHDYGVLYLEAVPRKDRTLEETESLLLEQVRLLREGEFEDSLVSACISNLRKDRKGEHETNAGRASFMLGSFLAGQEWPETLDRIQRMEKLTKKDVVRAARKHLSGGHVAGFRRDAPRKVLSVEKPKIDKIAIDPSRRSEFMKRIPPMPSRELQPVFLDPRKDFRTAEDAKGARVYYVRNPMNDLFSLSFHVDIGTRQDNKMEMAAQLLDLAGTERHSPEALKREWYKLAASFSVKVDRDETEITVSGLEENLEPSIALAMDLLEHPKATRENLEELIKKTLAQREDDRKDPDTISAALTEYARYGAKSSFLTMLPGPRMRALSVEELLGFVSGLLKHRHAVTYVGSLPLEKVLALLEKYGPQPAPLLEPPVYEPLEIRRTGKNTIFFLGKETTQSHVQIGFGDEVYNEANYIPAQLLDEYLGTGMGGVVYQELRESRGLAYSAYARYRFGRRKSDQNILAAGIECQPDKAAEAVEVFNGLFDGMVPSQERFSKTAESLLSSYRAAKLGFREIIPAVRSWERLGLSVDPRKARYELLQKTEMSAMMGFYRAHVQGRPRVMSILGDKSRMDVEALRKTGEIVEVDLDKIFVR